jgi:hypothetical protein
VRRRSKLIGFQLSFAFNLKLLNRVDRASDSSFISSFNRFSK